MSNAVVDFIVQRGAVAKDRPISFNAERVKMEDNTYSPTLTYKSLKVAISGVRLNGLLKYNNGHEGWRKTNPERYLEAAMRHLEAYADGEEYDPESNKTHLAHAATNIMFLVECSSKEKK